MTSVTTAIQVGITAAVDLKRAYIMGRVVTGSVAVLIGNNGYLQDLQDFHIIVTIYRIVKLNLRNHKMYRINNNMTMKTSMYFEQFMES